MFIMNEKIGKFSRGRKRKLRTENTTAKIKIVFNSGMEMPGEREEKPEDVSVESI